jgi:DNA topoisomerase-1
VEGTDNPEEALAQHDVLLPEMTTHQRLVCHELTAKSHTTQPPARYTEASLTRTLEERGIGRPSTYASIIDTIQNRDYVFKKGNALVPTWTAFTVIRMLEEHLGTLVDYDFTAQMEEYLDEISRNEKDYLEYLRRFYFGSGGGVGLKPLLESKRGEIDPKNTSRYSLGIPESGEYRQEVFVRDGRFGPFIEQADRKASLPQGIAPDELSLQSALEMLDSAAQGETPMGFCPVTQKPIYMKVGRFGPYVQLGDADDEEKRNASLLRGMNPEDVNLEVALKLLSLPRDLGEHPELKEPIIATNGKFGPYVKCGSETRSLPADLSPLDVTFAQAVELLAQPKTRGRGASKKEPLRVFEKPSPVTDSVVQVLDGRFGAYVTDGVTNASLPRDSKVEELTFEAALDLLAVRAASGGSKRKSPKKAKTATSGKSSTAKAATKTGTSGKKAAAKKASKKSTPSSGKRAKKVSPEGDM